MSNIQIHNYDSDNPVSGQTWTTEELQRDFIVEGFVAPYVAVRRKSDGASGLLEFKHSPRVYFNWQEAG